MDIITYKEREALMEYATIKSKTQEQMSVILVKRADFKESIVGCEMMANGAETGILILSLGKELGKKPWQSILIGGPEWEYAMELSEGSPQCSLQTSASWEMKSKWKKEWDCTSVCN